MIKAVVFDFDNTLVDFMKMKKVAVRAACAAMVDAGLPLDMASAEKRIDAIYDEKGIEFQKVFDIFLEQVLGVVNHKILAAGIVAYRRAREAELVTYPGVYHTLLKLFKLNYKLAVLSDAPQKEVWLRLAHLNLHHIFETVVVFEDTGVKKPDAAPFLEVVRRLGVKPEEAVMVGDWPERDIEGAKKIGMVSVFAKYGFAFPSGLEEAEKNADFIINDISELPAILQKLSKPVNESVNVV